MSTREITLCDRCGEENVVGALSLKAVAPIVHDAPGRGDERDLEVDICPDCCIRIVKNLFDHMNTLERHRWVQDKILGAWP